MTPRAHRILTLLLTVALLGQCAGLVPRADQPEITTAHSCLEEVAP